MKPHDSGRSRDDRRIHNVQRLQPAAPADPDRRRRDLFTPTILAAVRKSSRLGVVLAVNLLLGWTVAGWIVALVMAITSPKWPDRP